MPKGQSVYLDLLRTLAALAVFGAHLTNPNVTSVGITLPPLLGHGAVIIFFVLSGHLISYVAMTRETEWRVFACRRAARIYSVAIPALLVTAAVDHFMLYNGTGGNVRLYQYDNIFKYVILFLSFTTDIWFLQEDAFSNVPYWSLCYEVWYYIAFGSLIFLSGWRRILAILAVAILVGPRLWLLFPVWLMGWGVHYAQRAWPLDPITAKRLFLASGLAVVVILSTNHTMLINMWFDEWLNGIPSQYFRYSQYVFTDIFLGLLVSVNIWSARFSNLNLEYVDKVILYAASFSFTLYLMHFPLLFLWSVVFEARLLPVMLATLASVWLIGMATEHQRGRLQRWLMHAAGIRAMA